MSQKKQQPINKYTSTTEDSFWNCLLCTFTNPKDYLVCGGCNFLHNECISPTQLSLVSSSESTSTYSAPASTSAFSVLPSSISQEDRDSEKPSSSNPKKAPSITKTSLGKRPSSDESGNISDDESEDGSEWKDHGEEEAEERSKMCLKSS